MNRWYRRRDRAGKPASREPAPLMVWVQGSARSLPAGPTYLVGRDPECDIVIPDARVSWRHAVLWLEDRRWMLADNGSTNGTYAAGRPVSRIEIYGRCLVRLCDPAAGPVLGCTVDRAGPRGLACPA